MSLPLLREQEAEEQKAATVRQDNFAKDCDYNVTHTFVPAVRIPGPLVPFTDEVIASTLAKAPAV